MSNIITTIKKELRSILRDKKTIAVFLIYPIMIPVMIMLYGTMYENIDSEEVVYTIGLNYQVSENEKALLDELNLDYKYYDNDKELYKSYENNEISGYIEYDKKTNNYEINADMSKTTGMEAGSLMYQYLESYSTYLTNDYLINEGIDLETAYNNFTITEEDLGKTDYMLIMTLQISIMYIILSICFSTSNMATQATATEKENGTLETILTFPVNKTELITGKYLASVITGIISGLCSLAFMLVGLFIGKQQYAIFKNIDISISASTIIGAVLTIIAASIFVGGISLLLTAFSTSYKEAQSKGSMITLVAMIPMFVSLLEIEISKVYYLIPVCNISQTLNDIFTNNINPLNILITFGSTTIYAILVIIFIIKAYNSEKILFNN